MPHRETYTLNRLAQIIQLLDGDLLLLLALVLLPSLALVVVALGGRCTVGVIFGWGCLVGGGRFDRIGGENFVCHRAMSVAAKV